MAPNQFNYDIMIAEQCTIVSFNNAYCDITIPIVCMLNKESRQEVDDSLTEGYKKLFDVVQT